MLPWGSHFSRGSDVVWRAHFSRFERALTSAPCAMRSRIIAGCRSADAHISAVCPCQPSLASTAAPRDLPSATTIRIFDANVYQQNPSMAGYAREIRQEW